MFERYCTVIEADVIKNFGFVHIDAEVQGCSSIEKISLKNNLRMGFDPARFITFGNVKPF